jgi:hypothetical protein
MPAARRWSGQPLSPAIDASAPPPVIAAHGTPRAIASWASDSVSSVNPE